MFFSQQQSETVAILCLSLTENKKTITMLEVKVCTNNNHCTMITKKKKNIKNYNLLFYFQLLVKCTIIS